MKFHKNGSLPQKDEIFVFGSNLAGVHGAGAAKQALKYGARMGQGIGLFVGLHGSSYAIPTKDFDIKTLPLDKIKPYVERFKKFTLQTNGLANFFITAIGTGLAGYSHAQIAPLFRGCGDNCSFPEPWAPYLTYRGD